MMLGSSTTKVENYSAQIKSVNGKFTMDISITKVDKPVLMYVENPYFKTLLKKHSHLDWVKVHDYDKQQLPIHVVLGASEYTAIKTKTAPRVGLPGEPVAENTHLGWTIISPGQEVDTSPLLLTQSMSSFAVWTCLD